MAWTGYHGAGMSADEMAHDMRDRFCICLGFKVPIFAYRYGTDETTEDISKWLYD